MYKYYLKLLILIILILPCSIEDSYGVSVALNSTNPERLVEGDGNSQFIELNLTIDPPGSTFDLKVDYLSPDAQPGEREPFIEKQTIKVNGPVDKNREPRYIRVTLPQVFDKIGVYYIWYIENGKEEPLPQPQFFHEPKPDSILSRISKFFHNLARNKSLSVPDSDQVSVWIAPMPKEADQQIDETSIKPAIRSAIMPSWSPDGKMIVCSALQQGRRVIALYRFRENGKMPEMWRWISIKDGNDLCPIWSPKGDAIAFIRSIRDKDELWVLYLDENKKPKQEAKVTESNSVQQTIGWDEKMGIIFEAGWDPKGIVKTTQLWELNMKNGKPETNLRLVPLPGPYIPLQRYIPNQHSIISAIEETIHANLMTKLYIIRENGEKMLLLDGNCFDQRPAVSNDCRWLAFDSNRVYPD